MSDFSSFEEDRLIWTRSRDEIINRWELYAEWNMVSRIGKMFGGETEDKPNAINPPEVNGVDTLNTLERLFG